MKSEHTSLVEAKKDVDEKFASSVTEIKTLKSSIESKDQEILQLKNESTQKDDEITQLKEQINNLKQVPAPGSNGLSPQSEPGASETKDDLSTFCEKIPEIIRPSPNV